MMLDLDEWAKVEGSLEKQRTAGASRVKTEQYTFDEIRNNVADYERMWLKQRVREGQIDPERAEAEAARLGCAPLVTPPDTELLNPMTERYWTALMALAWILWREPDAVRRHWDEWRSQLKVWRAHLVGHSLWPIGPTSLLELRHDAQIVQPASRRATTVSIDHALGALRHLVIEGRVKAYGRVGGEDWERIDLEHPAEAHWSADGRDLGRFQDIRLDRCDVMEHCRFMTSRMKSSAGAETACVQFLTSAMAAWKKKPERRRPTRNELWREAQQKFSGLSEAAYKRARKTAIQASGASEFARSGRRRKSAT